MRKDRFRLLLAALTMAGAAAAQQVAPDIVGAQGNYVLGADDVISIRAGDADEISDKAIRIGPNGMITLPTIGRVQASGLTTDELEKELAGRLKQFVRVPEVSVNIVEMKSQPVSVIGSVRTPGVIQLQGRKTLVEVLSLAGGLREDAGYSIKIARQKQYGPIPLGNAAVDSTSQFSVAEVSVKDVMDARKPEENILVMPNDVISVPKGDMVYVVGDVNKSGAFVFGQQSQVSVLQALSLASGLQRTASLAHAKILRASTSESQRTEIAVNLKKILEGKDHDIAMQPDDILFVPGNKTKAVALRAVEAVLTVASGLAIYRVGN